MVWSAFFKSSKKKNEISLTSLGDLFDGKPRGLSHWIRALAHSRKGSGLDSLPSHFRFALKASNIHKTSEICMIDERKHFNPENPL